MIFAIVARHHGGLLSLQRFKEAIAAGPSPAQDETQPAVSLQSLATFFPYRLPTLSEAQEALVAEALGRAEGNQGIAVGMPGLSCQTLNKRLMRRK
jgi:two-component system nitrogen regulation response regulator GlnG